MAISAPLPQPPLFTRPFVLAATATLMLSLAGFLFVHFPGFLHDLGAAEAQIGRMMAATAVGAVLAWPFIGRAMNRFGRRRVMLAGCGSFLLVIGLYLRISEIGPLIYLIRVLDGAVQALWFTALFTYGADLIPAQRRTEGLAIFGISALVPIGLGAFFGDTILLYADYRELFLGALALAAAGFALCLPLRDVPTTTAHADSPQEGLFAAVTDRSLVPVWCAALAFFLALFGLFGFMKTFVTTTGTGSVGSFFAAYAAIALALRLFLGWLPDRIGPKPMVGVSLSCYALGFVLLANAQTSSHVLLAGLLCGAGHGFTYPVLLSLVVSRVSEQRRGSAVACYTTTDALGTLIGGPTIGFLIQQSGYDVGFLTLALILVIGMALFYGLDRKTAPQPQACSIPDDEADAKRSPAAPSAGQAPAPTTQVDGPELRAPVETGASASRPRPD